MKLGMLTLIPVLAILAVGAANPLKADSMDACLAGMERANKYDRELNDAKEYCENYKPPQNVSDIEQDELSQQACALIHRVCEKIDAASGARACLNARNEASGAGRAEEYYRTLKAVYDSCQVQ